MFLNFLLGHRTSKICPYYVISVYSSMTKFKAAAVHLGKEFAD